MAYIYLQHKNFPVAEVGVNSPIPFELGMQGGNITFDGSNTITINEAGVYVAHWHIPARLKEILGVTPLGLLNGRKRNILISLIKNGGEVLGRSATNVDERSLVNNVILNIIINAIQELTILPETIDTDDYNLKQEYSEMVSGVCVFKAKHGDTIQLRNYSLTGIEIPTHSNSAACPMCSGGTFALYKIDEYPCSNPCVNSFDDDQVIRGCCND